MFTIGSGGKKRSIKEAGRMRRKARGDEAVGEGVKGTMMLASSLAESREWPLSVYRRGPRVQAL